MAEDSAPDLTRKQKRVINELPASKPAIADALDVQPTTVEGHFERLDAKGVSVDYDRDANEWYLADDDAHRLRRLSTETKQMRTRRASELIEEEQAYLFRRLRRTDPLTAPAKHDAGKESFGVILGDTHFGDVVEKEYWNDDKGTYEPVQVYSSEIAGEKVATFAQKSLRIRDLMASTTEFDDCYVFLLGDISTGMYIYDGQVSHIDNPLKNQVEESVAALYQLIATYAEAFDTVQVRAVPGNHGTDKPNAAIGANTDLITYAWTDDRLRDSGYENVDFRYAEAHEYLNTTARDWRFHVRHGHDELEHVDETAASSRDWRGLRDEFGFDAAMKGHHHAPSFHKVLNAYPVFACPSPKPGGDFPSKIGKPDVSRYSDLGWVFGLSDSRPVTWSFLLDDRGGPAG